MNKHLLFVHILKTGFFLLLCSCSQNQFQSQSQIPTSKTIQTTASSPASQIQLEADFSMAVAAIDKANYVNEADLQNSKWIFLGYHEVLMTTDGKGAIAQTIPSTETNIQYSSIQKEDCPKDMYCTAVLRPYLNARISSKCGIADYRSSFEQVFSLNGLLNRNLTMSLLSTNESFDCSENDMLLWSKLKTLGQHEFGFALMTEKYLFIKFYNSNYIFKKAN